MSRGTAVEQTAQRVDRLVRSLVGVEDLRPSCDGAGRLRVLHVLRNAQVSDQQLIRNIVSGLQAGLGLRVEATTIRIYCDSAVFATALAAATQGSAPAQPVDGGHDAPASPAGGVQASQQGNGHGANGHGSNGHGPTTANGAAPAKVRSTPSADALSNGLTNGSHRPDAGLNGHTGGHGTNGSHGKSPAVSGRATAACRVEPGALGVERLTMERLGVMLRCRVVLALDQHRYSAIAEAPDGANAEAELAARVTVDALRAGALTCTHLEGVSVTSIADRKYVVAALRSAGAEQARAGAAPLAENMARTAAEAVLRAVGPITAAHRTAAERRLGRL